ncbi:hypothetical protein llap_2519 [Limosa lapponica baueri]|uniref:Uncharacterized protein n=1 Tax=Limosa lapponica baueri TaxID=1758121 RepID=A0A2I0UM69_LIMLA|nr:hypothetical protein llap_2519 [Limosa lapponica baueri]
MPGSATLEEVEDSCISFSLWTRGYSNSFAPNVLKPVATGVKELSFMDHLKDLEGNDATENLRERLGGNWRYITPSSVSQPMVCGPQVVCQKSKGLQSDCRQFLETDTSILICCQKKSKDNRQ